MPLLAHAVLAYAGGLAAGLQDVAGIAGTAAMVALCFGAACRRSALMAWGGAAAIGALVGRVTLDVDRRCAETIAAARSFEIVLADDAAAGSYARGSLRTGRCTTSGGVALAAGAARAGERIAVQGRPLVDGRRARIVDARLQTRQHGDWASRWRASTGASLDTLFGPNAALARALLIADTRTISPEVRDRFAAAGLVHILSISGLHVAIIAGAVALTLQAARCSARATALGTGALVAVYVVLLGAPPPAVRSAVMLVAANGSTLLQRPTSPWALLGAGALLPLLVDPRAVTDVGWALSVSGMAALIAAPAVHRRLSLGGGWRGAVGQALVTSTVASIVTAPLVAWYFGSLSLIAPLANLAAAPVITFAQPVLFLALLLAPVRPVASLVADAASPLLALLDWIARIAAAVPFASVSVAPSLTAAVLGAAAVAGLIAAVLSRGPGRPLMLAAGALAMSAWLPLVPRRPGDVELHVIDVGQGDALALRTGRGRWVVIDAGRSWKGGDAGRMAVIPYLRRYGGPVAAFILSHPHADHAGGAASLVNALTPDEYVDGGYVLASDAYRRSLDAVRARSVRWRRARPEDTLVVDDVRMAILAPDSAWVMRMTDPNEASVVMMIEVGAVRFLLSGDAERDEEGWLVERYADALKADVLKLGHHGSATSSTAAFLDAVRPRIAIASVGAGNSYGHPSAEVLASLGRRGVSVYRTDRDGSVVVRTDGRKVSVSTGGRW